MSFLRVGRHHVMCKKSTQPFSHASQCYASKDDVYIFDTTTITPFLDANFGALLKLSAVQPSVISTAIRSCSLTLLQISVDGLVAGFAMVGRLEHAGAFFHIKLHANLDGKLLRVCCAWARECATTPWTEPYNSLDFSWSRDAMFCAPTDTSDLTLNPKRLFHACMFKSSSRTHSPPLTDAEFQHFTETRIESVDTPSVDTPFQTSTDAEDLLSNASQIAAAYERDAAASAARAQRFSMKLLFMDAARVGQKRARDNVLQAEQQLAEALSARTRADAEFACAEKELREVMKGV